MAERCTIERVEWRTAYARNGNAHNPTKYYRWAVTYAGRPVGSAATLREAKALAAEFEAAPEW